MRTEKEIQAMLKDLEEHYNFLLCTREWGRRNRTLGMILALKWVLKRVKDL